MKGRVLSLLAALSLLLCCAACGPAPKEGSYQLYFLTDPQVSNGSALDTQSFDRTDCTAFHAPETPCPTPGCLLSALLAGPGEEGLVSPFPRGVTVRGWTWDENQPGRLRVTLSEQYGGLADISQTLADYCIVLTLGQLEGLETVELRVAGDQTKRELSVDEAILDHSLPTLP